MTDGSIAATLLLGFVLGLRHALDADHVAAVATVLGGEEDGAAAGRGRSIRGPLWTGLLWGAGHAAVLLIAGGLLLALRARVPGGLARAFELAVALMLIVLGARALAAALRGRVHVHEHDHDGVRHAHLHFHARPHPGGVAHAHPHPLRLAVRPLLIGGLHGLAGSAGVALLALATLPTMLLGCLYLGVFGAGSMVGMGLLSAALGAPLLLARRRSARLHKLLRAAAGVGGLSVGLLLAWEIGAGGAVPH